MRTLINNIGNIYTPDTQNHYGSIQHFQHRSVLIEDGIVRHISQSKTEISDAYDKIIDADGKTLLPGFVDAHTHPVFWQTRESEFIMRIEGKSYEEIAEAGGGIRNSARNFQNAEKEDIKDITKKRISTFFKYGTTTIEAKSGYGLSLESELKALEVIAELNSEQDLEMIPTFLGAHEVPDDYRSRRDQYIQLVIDRMIPAVTDRDLAKYCDVFCEKGVFSLDETRRILDAARKKGLKARIHADELHAFGAAELAAEQKACTADHLVKVSDTGIKAMADAGVIPVLLPATTFFLRKDEYAPARKMLDSGCEVALATDFNPGSSMTQNMQLVWTIGALKLGMMPGELLWATTIIPAKSLDLSDRLGSIGLNKQADLVLLDIPNLDYLPYHMGINHVVMTMKKGKIVYQRDN